MGDCRLIGLLSWYDESPGWLAELVHSMGRAGIEHIVALDGAYGAYPGAQATTGVAQSDAILCAASQAGMGATVTVPPGPWAGNEIEKRTVLFAMAHSLVRPGVDWLWILDGDEVITEAPNLRERLEATHHDVASCTLWEGTWNTQPLRMIYRAQPSGIHLCGHHACYMTGNGRLLWDNWQPVNEASCEALDDVRVQHRPGDRPQARQEARMEYYGRVKARQLERV